MKWLGLATIACGLVMTTHALAEFKVKVLDVPPKFIPKLPAGASVMKPTKIESQEQLAKHFPRKAAQVYFAEAMSFKTSYLLFFHWSGSSGDSLQPKATQNADGKDALKILFKPGFTDDVKTHTLFIVVPKGVDYSISDPTK